MHLWLENMETDEAKRNLVEELTGPFRTIEGTNWKREDDGAPAWWHGDEDAYEGTMARLGNIPQRGRT
jgi:hypothetical protein